MLSTMIVPVSLSNSFNFGFQSFVIFNISQRVSYILNFEVLVSVTDEAFQIGIGSGKLFVFLAVMTGINVPISLSQVDVQAGDLNISINSEAVGPF